ncbi:hypothetical protein DYD21_06835 [Rhodohalobacter sp. SW132]|nr:hypothetical protein DYD21_06835 [Rhodohalobacter sp. SW132]
MRATIKWSICLLFISYMIGCSELFDSDSKNKEMLLVALEDFSIKSDQEVYNIDQEDSPLKITYSYINKGNQNFYPGSCLGVPSDVLEKLVDGEWIIAYSPVCPDILRSPIKIEPVKSYEAAIHLSPSIWDPESEDESWHISDIEGTYRVREQVYGEWNMKKYDSGNLQSEIVFSNSFVIKKNL